MKSSQKIEIYFSSNNKKIHHLFISDKKYHLFQIYHIIKKYNLFQTIYLFQTQKHKKIHQINK